MPVAKTKLLGSGVARGAPVPRKYRGELPRDRHRPCGAVGLRWPTVAVPVHLPSKLDFRLLEIIDTHVGPGQAAELGDPCPRQRGDREQRPERLVRRGDRLVELLALEDWPPLRQRE